MAKEAQLVVLLVHAMYQDLWDAIRANLPADESHELVVSRSGLVPPGGMTG